VKYEGTYLEGRKHGIGKLQLPNGDKYQGYFVADKFHGDGSYFFANGDVYSYHVLDAQVSYKLPSIKSVVRVGGNNILNQYYVTAPGNPSIGGLYYVQFAYNIF
jgi:outer membrane receptor protein involved in Fe transport